jgi:Mce-associated membrane protein
MPPPRRRRPVQPATRVRLPRTTRPGGASATEAPEAPEAPDAEPVSGSRDGVLTEDDLTSQEAPVSGDLDSAPAGEDLDDDFDDDLDDLDEDAGEDSAEEPEPVRAAGTRRGNKMLLPACLAGVAVILGGLAVWFAVQAGNTGSGVNEQNTALIDTAATTEVNRQIDTAINTVFSYNYADTATTRTAAQAVLTGKAIQQYNSLFKLVEQDAPTEKLVLTTTVTNSGVSMLSGNRAQVLIFANQQDTGGSTRSTTDAGAMFSVDAVFQGGRWKIDGIDTFSAGT